MKPQRSSIRTTVRVPERVPELHRIAERRGTADRIAGRLAEDVRGQEHHPSEPHPHEPPKLPEGYRLDLSEDPDAPALRRPDGTVAARFAARGLTREALEREALEDLLLVARLRGGEVQL